MAGRDYDITVYGATGVTGSEVARYLLKQAPARFRVALAGRHASKLQAVLESCTNTHGVTVQVLGGIDSLQPDTVQRMAASSRLVIACVGPFRLYGEPVFKACAEAGTDYLDICGEPEFIERMELTYFDRARHSSCLMASACGFDSVPSDLGALMVQRCFVPPAVPSSVQAVISVSTTAKTGVKIHYPTWESAVHGMSSVDSLRRLRAEAKAAGRQAPYKAAGPRPRLAAGPTYDARLKTYTLPFPGADAAVVRRTQSALAAAGEAPVHFEARFAVASRYYVCLTIALGGLMAALCKSGWGQGLLLKHYGAFSYGVVTNKAPEGEEITGTRARLDLLGRGYSSAAMAVDPTAKPDLQVTAAVTMPEPGYVATPIITVDTALTLLEERQQLLARAGGGGVFTAGALFRDSSLVERLTQHGVVFQVLQKSW